MHEAQAILLRLLRFAPGPAWHRNPAPRRTYPRRPVLMPSSRPEICPGYLQCATSSAFSCCIMLQKFPCVFKGHHSLSEKQRRADKIRQAKAELEAEAKAAAEAKLKAEDEAARKREAEGRRKGGRQAAPPSSVPDAKAQKNFTDPQSRIMKSKDGVGQALHDPASRIGDDHP